MRVFAKSDAMQLLVCLALKHWLPCTTDSTGSRGVGSESEHRNRESLSQVWYSAVRVLHGGVAVVGDKGTLEPHLFTILPRELFSIPPNLMSTKVEKATSSSGLSRGIPWRTAL